MDYHGGLGGTGNFLVQALGGPNLADIGVWQRHRLVFALGLGETGIPLEVSLSRNAAPPFDQIRLSPDVFPFHLH
jgi:hypothetical protein